MYLVSWEYDMSSHIAVYEGHFDLIFRLHDIIQAASLLDRSSCKVLKESPEKNNLHEKKLALCFKLLLFVFIELPNTRHTITVIKYRCLSPFKCPVISQI